MLANTKAQKFQASVLFFAHKDKKKPVKLTGFYKGAFKCNALLLYIMKKLQVMCYCNHKTNRRTEKRLQTFLIFFIKFYKKTPKDLLNSVLGIKKAAIETAYAS